MKDEGIRIIKLEKMRVASASGFGASPEGLAWDKLLTWASEQGFLDSLQNHRFFGFNNPHPSPGSPEYGYEQWMTVSPDSEAQGDIKIKEFSGGTYAVALCVGLGEIENVWRRLFDWRAESAYQEMDHQSLEECLTPQMIISMMQGKAGPDELGFDLYLPVGDYKTGS